MSHDSLGDNFINTGLAQGFAKKVEEHLVKAQQALDRGASEQAHEHIKRVGEASSDLFFNHSSPQLSEAENEEYRRFTNLRFFKDERNGLIGERHIDEKVYNQLQELDRKARGQGG
jgi:hypothetical protein